jgi:hypothetical protein
MGINWNFSNPGAFGDSFGPLSGIMAGIAAVSAIAAFQAQQAEIERAKIREIDEDKLRRKSDFERTFFQLLEAFQRIVTETDIHGSGPTKTGRDAFRAILQKFESENARLASAEKSWTSLIEYYRNDLNHYFRFMYHIVNFVHNSDMEDKYFYTRILRSSLSDSELTLVALNCAYGEGNPKFKRLVERYSILHNISQEQRTRWGLDGLFKKVAFLKA